MYHITKIHKENKKKEIEKKCSPLNKRMKRKKMNELDRTSYEQSSFEKAEKPRNVSV